MNNFEEEAVQINCSHLRNSKDRLPKHSVVEFVPNKSALQKGGKGSSCIRLRQTFTKVP
jgi:hypothetical protein